MESAKYAFLVKILFIDITIVSFYFELYLFIYIVYYSYHNRKNEMKEKTLKINNQAGIHCRPASAILNAIIEFPDHRFVVYLPGREDTELNSILSLIALGLQCGDRITLRVSGPDEENACAKIAALFEYEFDFPPRM